MDNPRLLTRPELVQFCPEAALPIANRVALNQDAKTAPIVQAATLRAVGEWLDSRPHYGEAATGSYVYVDILDIEALRNGQMPAGWEKKGR